MLKILFLSTAVGALGSGQGGGVELTVQNAAQALQDKGHKLVVVAPEGSYLKGITVKAIAGRVQIPIQTQSRDVSIQLPPNSVLANMWEYARQVQQDWDIMVNFSFDWLPFYLTPFFEHTKIAHFISMASTTEGTDAIMNAVIQKYPHAFGVCTQAQANTFAFAKACEILSGGLDLSLYQFNNCPEKYLAWLGRIAPEKALEDAVEAATITGVPLKIFGKLQNPEYWDKICQDFPDAPIEYRGFLSTAELQQELGKCRALLMTPRWIEAFGNVAMEALACGVPVIAYRRGGPSEIIKHGETGFLVEPDSVNGLVEAIKNIDLIDRRHCRQQAETEYSLSALGDRFEAWLEKIVSVK
ncbi:MAG: glycosyltransferase family 4 protein [Pleurocapsa sp.]